MDKTPLSIGRLRLGAVPRVVLCATDARGGRLPPRCAPDLIEARIDLFAQHAPDYVQKLLRRLRRPGYPIIATIRTVAEGGRWRGSIRDRERLFTAVLPLVDAVDVELSSRTLAGRVVKAAHAEGRLAIVSAHDLDRTPPAATLVRRIRAARTLGADVVKLAAHANDMEDLSTLLRVLLSHPRTPLVLVAMGPVGTMSRILFAAAGSLLTYAFAEGDAPAAPGQLPINALQAELARYCRPYAALQRRRVSRRTAG